MVSFQFKQGTDKNWKIYDVHYRGDQPEVKLLEILTNAAGASQANSTTGQSEASTIQGKLQTGKTESLILYVGEETGDYAAYCFTNDSETGRAILAACKNQEQCEVKGTIDDYRCKVPGLEADLSASGKIVKVQSVKSLGRKK